MNQRDDETVYRLAPRWGTLEDILAAHGDDLRIDLGCGYYKPAGYVGLDNMSGTGIQVVNDETGPDILVDINRFGIPLPDDSCAVVRASHFLEHSKLDFVLDEMHRVLRPGGRLELIVPYANSAEGMYPGHLLFFTERWFEESPQYNSLFHTQRTAFDESDTWKTLPRLVRAVIPFGFARRFLFNACWQMRLDAVSAKREPDGTG